MIRKCLIAVLIFAIIGVACGPGLRSKMVGKWANKYGSSVWDIDSNGIVSVWEKNDSGADKIIASGAVREQDSETIDIRWMDPPPKTDRIKVKFNESGGMVLTLPDGTQRVFVKAE